MARPTNRLPRFKRAAAEVNLILTKRDLEEILATVHAYRLLTSDQIQALAKGSRQGVLRRLQKLFHAGLLDRVAPRLTYGAGSEPMVYAISNKGIRTLQKEGLIEKLTKTDCSHKNRKIGDLFIRHTLLVSHIRAVTSLACRNHAELTMLCWKEGREIQDTIEVAVPCGWERIPVAPDGFFSLGCGERKANFFVEADRGTMAIRRFTRKLQGFAAWWREERHHAKVGIKSFRVLTVTSSAARLGNLVSAAGGAESVRSRGRMFLFTTEDKIALDSPETIFNKVWTVPGEDEPCSLL